MKLHATLLIVTFTLRSFWSFGAAQSEPPLSEVIAKVRENIRQARNTLPDFVCTERYTSKGFENGKVKRQKVVTSIFTGLREQTKQGTPSMKESRVVTAIDGKVVRKGKWPSDLPLNTDGMTANLLTLALDAGDAFDYTSAGIEQTGTSRTLRIQFANKPEQKTTTVTTNGKQISEKAAGTAWVDLGSMQVVRLDRQFLNLNEAGTGIKTLSISAHYGKANIGNSEFWMPQVVRGEAVLTSARKTDVHTADYLAEYSDCRKFDVSVDLKF